MDILNNSNVLNGGNNGSPDLLKSKNSNTNNFPLDSDSSHSFNSISSTPNSLISTPSPSSTDNNSLGNAHNNLSQSSNANSDTLSLMLQHYSLLSNSGANNVDSFSQYFNADTGNNMLSSYLHDMNFNNGRFNGTSPSNKSHKGNNVLSNNGGNTSMLPAVSGSRKKQPSNVGPNSGANLSSKSNGNNSIPPGLGGYNLGKNSTLVNGQAMNSNNNKPKNLRTLMNNSNNIMNSNSKMRLTNGDASNNKFPDGLYSPIAGASLSSIPPQALPPQPSFSNFQLPNGDSFDLPFSRSNSNNFLTSSLSNNNSSSWNMKSDQEVSNVFDELLSGTSPFKGRDKVNPAGEIGSGVKSGDPLNLDSILSGLSIPKSERDIWLQGNEASSNSQLGSFYNNSSIPARDLITSAAVSPASTSNASNGPSNLFESTWSPSSPSANAFNAWGDSFSLPAFANDTGNALDTRNSTNISSTSDFDIKKLMSNEKVALASLLDNSTQIDMKGRTQLNDILTMFKKYIFEAIVLQDMNLCQSNFDNYFGMMKTDLAKFEASTFTIEELKLFQDIYTSLVHGRDKFADEKLSLDANLEQFNHLIKNLLLSSAPSNVFMYDDNLLRKVSDKLFGTFNVLYSAKHNNTFLNLVKFYRKMIYSIPTEILNNLPTIIQQSKMMNENCGHTGDPLLAAYRNFVIELNKHSQNRNAYPNIHEEEVDTADNGTPNIKNIRPSDIARNNKDVNNNKKIDALKDGNKLPSDKESDIKSMQAKQSCSKPQAPPIFSHVTQVKSEPAVYMPFYYPFDHNMLNLNGPISIFCNRIKVKAPYYLSPNRQTFDFIVDGELTKVMPGPIVLEKPDNLTTNKSFNKLIARLKKHFPNLSIKQLVDLTLQSKYSIMKKHKLQYGFSGFKLKDLVRYIAEYIYENAIVSSMHGGNSAAAAALAAKGVSWSKVASASNIAQPNGQVMMSPSTSGTKDSASVVSSNASPSPSPSLSSNPSTVQICALCKNFIINNATDEKMKMAVVACSHTFHKECIDFWTKINPVCPQCDQFILRNEEFPSL